MHNIKWPISNTYNNQTNGQAATLNDLINNLLLIMDFPISQNEEDNVLVDLFLDLVALLNCIGQEDIKVSWSTKL